MKTKYLDNFGAGHNSVIDSSLIVPGSGPIVENLYLDGLKLQSSKAAQVVAPTGGFLVPYWFRDELIERRFDEYTQTAFDTNKLYFTEDGVAKYDFHAADGTVTTHNLIEENPITFCAANPNYTVKKCSSGIEQQLDDLIEFEINNQYSTTTPIIKYAALIDSTINGATQAYKLGINNTFNHYINGEQGTKTTVALYINDHIVTSKEIEYKATFEVSTDKDFEQPEALQAMFYNEFVVRLPPGTHTTYVKVNSPSLAFKSRTYTFEILPTAVPYYPLNPRIVYRTYTFDFENDVTFNLENKPYFNEPKIFINSLQAETSSIIGSSVILTADDLNFHVSEKVGAVKVVIEDTPLDGEIAKTPVEVYVLAGEYSYEEEGLDEDFLGLHHNYEGELKYPLGAVSHISSVSSSSTGLLLGAATTKQPHLETVLAEEGELEINQDRHDFSTFSITQGENTFAVILQNTRLTTAQRAQSKFEYFTCFSVPITLLAVNLDIGSDLKLLPHINKADNDSVGEAVDGDSGTGIFNVYAMLNIDSEVLDNLKDLESSRRTMVDSNVKTLTLDDAEENSQAEIYDMAPDKGSQISFDQQKKERKALIDSAGRISYAITVVNPITRVESAPVYVLEFECLERAVELAIKDIPDDRTIRIYRRGSFQDKDSANSKFQLVKEIDYTSSEIAETDTMGVSQLSYLLTTENTLASQDDIEFGLVSKDKQRLFLTSENDIRFSVAGEFTKFKELGKISMSSEINGMVATTYGQVVFTKSGDIHNIRFANGVPIVEQLAANIPLLTDTTIAIVNDNVFFLSYEGIMLLRRTNVVNVTKDIVHKHEFNISHNPADYSATVLYNTFYLAEHNTNRLWSIDLDNRNRTIVHTSLEDTKNIIVMKGELYESTSTKLNKLFASDEELTMNYLSGNLVAPYYDIEKEFLDVKYVYRGDFVITIYIDNEKVNEVAVSSPTLIADRFYFDNTKNKGIELSVRIEGKGVVKSLRVNFEEVNNG